MNNTACLQKCFDSRCPERNSSKLCDGVVECYWCLKNKDNVLLEKPYCASSERCFRGKESPITGKFNGVVSISSVKHFCSGQRATTAELKHPPGFKLTLILRLDIPIPQSTPKTGGKTVKSPIINNRTDICKLRRFMQLTRSNEKDSFHL